MEANRLELLVQQVEAAESLLERMMGQVGALSCELKAMKQELSVLSEAVMGLKDEEETILAPVLSEEPFEEFHDITEVPLEEFHDITEEPLEDFHDITEEPLEEFHDITEEPLEEFHDITEEEVKLIETSEAMATEQVTEPVVEQVVKFEESSSLDVDEPLTVAERFGQEKQTGNLNEQFVTRFKTSLSRSMSLNDRFRFQRELFHGSQAEMREALADLEACASFSEAWDYICHKLDNELVADDDNEALQDFRHILEVHFS